MYQPNNVTDLNNLEENIKLMSQSFEQFGYEGLSFNGVRNTLLIVDLESNALFHKPEMLTGARYYYKYDGVFFPYKAETLEGIIKETYAVAVQLEKEKIKRYKKYLSNCEENLQALSEMPGSLQKIDRFEGYIL